MQANIEKMLDNYVYRIRDDVEDGWFYSFFRFSIGILILQHGAQLLFGAFGGIDGNGGTVGLASLIGVVAVVEFVGGIAIASGFLTRTAAIILAVVMIVKYATIYLPMGLLPIQNNGELALLFLLGSLMILNCGSGKFSLEEWFNGDK